VSPHRSFLFLSCNTPWVHALANELARRHSVHAVRFFDWRVYWQQQPSWPSETPAEHLTRETKVMPTGYTGLLEPLIRPFLRRRVQSWCWDLEKQSGSPPQVVVPYPYLKPWVESVPEHRLVYYNLDDYTLYRPERAERITRREDELVRTAHRTVCLSQHQVDALRDRNPDHADRIAHFPLGVSEGFLNPNPESKPAPRTVGYVGNLSDRVDWSFVNAVATQCPNLRFQFVGGADPEARDAPWEQARAEAFRRENVEHVGRVAQEAVTDYYWSFAANWIPYDPDHPFNRASCPTKIMDGLGSGRPMVSTDVPECRLYPDWIRIVESPKEAAEALHEILRDEHDPAAQVAFARQHTWTERARHFEDLTASPILRS
jgi:glycosyltransferase involved in cell wall biosynthesis